MRRFIVAYAVILYAIIILTSSDKKKGRYRSFLIRESHCEKPDRPYMPVPVAQLYTQVYNTSTKTNMSRGNLTILRDLKHISVKIKAFSMENGTWTLTRLFNIRCNGIMVGLLVKLLALDYDMKTCALGKGTYIFKDVDFNEADHAWALEREYGRMLWKFQVLMRNLTAICYEAETEIVPA